MRCLAALLLLVSCATAKPTPTPKATAVLVVHCDVSDASLWIDDRLFGDIGRLPSGVRITAGEHRVELRHDRYHTRYAEVALGAGERKVLEVSMPEVLP